MHTGERWRLGHRPALDGLRGIAILLVVLSHVFRDQLPNAGAVGVTVFFALSGFLITSLLLEERARAGGISVSRFYARRARRLAPALLVYLTVWTAWIAVTEAPLWGHAVAALLYISNWVLAAGAPLHHAFGITWSLSMEEQFYLLWPLAFLVTRGRPRRLACVAVLGVITAVVLRWVLWDGGEGAAAVYYRTDARMDSLLLGCLLAIAIHHRAGVPAWCRHLGGAGVAGVLICALSWSVELKYMVAPLLVAAATCAAIAASLVGRMGWLASSVLRWFGRRSYALYLWHYPLIVLAWAGSLPMWVAVVAAFVAAEASWWLVERRFLSPRLLHVAARRGVQRRRDDVLSEGGRRWPGCAGPARALPGAVEPVAGDQCAGGHLVNPAQGLGLFRTVLANRRREAERAKARAGQ